MSIKQTLKNKILGGCAPFASALVVLTAGGGVMAQPLVTIIVSATLDLNFGTLSAGAGGGTLTVPIAGARTSTGTVIPLAGAGLESPASISISASTGESVVVSMDMVTYSVDYPGAGSPMNVGAFDIDGGGATATVTIATNPVTIPLGATLTVGAGQSEGIYSGSYVVNANYL